MAGIAKLSLREVADKIKSRKPSVADSINKLTA
jgi:predicted DNA-binding protein YlxM (UPF0122 family)